MSETTETAIQQIIETGKRLDARGLAPATAGNYSVRLNDNRMAITVSGRHKGRLTANDIMLADMNGVPLENKKPSAETWLHVLIYKMYPHVRAVLHSHVVQGVALTRHLPKCQEIVLENYELLKAFPGVETHEAAIHIPVFDNSQDMKVLGVQTQKRLKAEMSAYIIRDHGIYTWGRDIAEAERITEALEHLLACEIEALKLEQGRKRA